MSNPLNFIWLVPAALVLFFVFRLVKTKGVNNGNLSGNKKSSAGWIYGLVIVILIGIIGFLYFHKVKEKGKAELVQESITPVGCPTTISAKEFSVMNLNDENDIASYFYDKGFVRDKYELDKGNKDARTVIEYNLHDEDWESGYGKYAHLVERGSVITNYNYWKQYLFYELTSREKFENFFEYLSSLGADTINPVNYSNYRELTYNHLSVTYKGKIYVKEGFDSESQRYKLWILNDSRLIPISNKDTIQKVK